MEGEGAGGGPAADGGERAGESVVEVAAAEPQSPTKGPEGGGVLGEIFMSFKAVKGTQKVPPCSARRRGPALTAPCPGARRRSG